MKTVVSIDVVVIGYKITSINFSKRLCNVTVFVSRDVTDVGQERNFKNVKLSSLLSWRLENQPDRYPVGVWNCGLNTSSNRLHNPYQMIKYFNKSSNSEELLLCPVEQRSSYIEITYDAFGNKMESAPRYRFHKKEYYKRWRNFVDVKNSRVSS